MEGQMPKISVMTLEKARSGAVPQGFSGPAAARSYYDDANFPLHLHLYDIAAGEVLRIAQGGTDRLAYVWHGAVEAGGCRLAQGSSLIVEHGRTLEIAGGSAPSQVLVFAAAHPPAAPRPGGHVHLLPVDRVARNDALAGASGVSGGMHFDSACPTCEIWLHENHFPGGPPLPPEEQAKGIHSHSEDEIIFVTAGQIRLGAKLYGPGTALAIAADTLYSFTPGPEGLSFINFRAGTPGDIQFANGMSISETGYWRERVTRPDYLEVA
jgi:hypothetical protein